MVYYIFKRSAGLSFGCCVIFADISFAISSSSSGLSDFVTTLQITVKMHSRSGVENRKPKLLLTRNRNLTAINKSSVNIKLLILLQLDKVT